MAKRVSKTHQKEPIANDKTVEYMNGTNEFEKQKPRPQTARNAPNLFQQLRLIRNASGRIKKNMFKRLIINLDGNDVANEDGSGSKELPFQAGLYKLSEI